MRAQEAFDELIRHGIWPFLRGHGFKRSTTTFHRPDGRNWQVINIQKSTYSDSREVSFTINLAVAIDSLRGGVRDWADGKRPAESRCHLRQRIGALLRGQDTWWSVTPDSNIEALTDTITTTLDQFGLPWLEAHSDERRLLDLARAPATLAAQRRDHLRWFGLLAQQHHETDLLKTIEAEQARREHEAARDR